ncbi:MAG: NAD(P)/FAD-dependent oxidoreductase [Nocardioidaceae bacterium]
MAEIVIVGGGLGGMAAAARLAKQRHRVTLLERGDSLGGALRGIEHGGFHWDSAANSTTLPAVLRDLFRKSGRPLEHYLDLQLSTPARRHMFSDGSVIDLPTGSRADQGAAVDAGLGPGFGRQWTEFVDGQAQHWHSLRHLVLDDPEGGARLSERSIAREIGARRSLAKLLKTSLGDDRLRAMASHSVALAGSNPRKVPAFVATESYVERTFGVWHPAGGMAGLVEALTTRLAERHVDVRCQAPVEAITAADGAVTGVTMTDGRRLKADVVICDLDPRVVFRHLLAANVAARGRRAFDAAVAVSPPDVTHLGLRGDVPDLPDEVVLHGEPLLVIRRGHRATSAGAVAWTVLRRGDGGEDVLEIMAARGVDARACVVARIHRDPNEMIAELGGSPFGLQWDGWRAHAQQATFGNPLPGLHLIGTAMHPGPTIPYVAWGAAHVAARIGRA